jgi:hypothetical protein
MAVEPGFSVCCLRSRRCHEPPKREIERVCASDRNPDGTRPPRAGSVALLGRDRARSSGSAGGVAIKILKIVRIIDVESL